MPLFIYNYDPDILMQYPTLVVYNNALEVSVPTPVY